MKSVFPRIAALTVTAALILTGCTSNKSTDSPSTDGEPAAAVSSSEETFEIVEVDGPPELTAGASRTLTASVISPTNGLPGLLVARTVEPAGEPTLSFTELTDRGKLTPLDLPVHIPGEILSVYAAGSEHMTVVGGTRRDNGIIQPFFWTSSDRETWSQVTLPAAYNGSSLNALTVDGETVHAVLSNMDSNATAIRIDGGKVTESALPSAPENLASGYGIAVHKSDVVVTGTVAAPGEASSNVSWMSKDGGETFGPSAEIADYRSTVSGAVYAHGKWVVTGTKPNKAGDHLPITWTSTNGSDWNYDNRRWNHLEADWSPWYDQSDAIVGAPVVDGDGTVYVWATSALNQWGAVYFRDSSGSWATDNRHASDSKAADVGAVGMLALGDNGQINVLRGKSSWTQLSMITEIAWKDVRTLSLRETQYSFDAVDISPQGVGFPLVRGTFTEDGDGWERGSDGMRVIASESSVTIDALPEDLEAMWVASDVSSDTQVLIGTHGHETRILRRAKDSEPELADADLRNVFGSNYITHVPGTGYVAAVIERPSFDFTSGANQASFLTSPDAISWNRATAADVGNTDPLGSYVMRICALPGGEALAIGNSGTAPTTWKFADEKWVGATFEEIPEGGSLQSCVSTPDSVLVTVQVGGYQQQWQTTDGLTFEEVNTFPRAITVYTDFATTGSLYLVGAFIETAEYTGAALLLSKDATNWRSLPVPAYGAVRVGVHEDVAFMGVGTNGGPRFFQLRDLDSAWESAEPLT